MFSISSSSNTNVLFVGSERDVDNSGQFDCTGGGAAPCSLSVKGGLNCCEFLTLDQ